MSLMPLPVETLSLIPKVMEVGNQNFNWKDQEAEKEKHSQQNRVVSAPKTLPKQNLRC